MRNNNVLGIVFCNTADDKLSDLTAMRTMSSVPFGCRYRLIDFPLSSMVNAGISKVGLITKQNFQSLADHVGNGRPWDLARRRGGLYILSPFSSYTSGQNSCKIDALYGNLNFLQKSVEEYVLLCDANLITNIDIEALIDAHISRQADITVAYKKGLGGSDFITLNGERVAGFTKGSDSDNPNGFMQIVLMKKQLLISLIEEANLHNYKDFTADILDRKCGSYVIYGYEISEHAIVIDSMQSYFNANMSLLDRSVRDCLFNMQRPVYTKLRDDTPTRYGFEAQVSDSLIADGCTIEGTVKNSIVFRGVKVSRGAVVENCILMQSANVGINTQLSYVVADKNVTFNQDRTLMGCQSFPLVIGKGLSV